MMRRVFDEQLDKLNIDLTKMGHLVEVSIENMIDAFKHHDKALAKEIIENDRLINDMERSIESRAFSLILRQQPIASDLRNVTSALKIVTDLERIGDQAADIAEIIYHFEGKHAYRTVEHIPTMAKKAKIMVHEAIDAFIKKDLTTAQMVKDMDDEIDSLFEEVKQEVIEILKENSEKVDYCIDFLMIAKYLERVGDHAVNICEWLEFNQTGTVNQHRLI
ncbi:MAG: phosphate signaling complex protein PhoU [Longibaculum muris]|mgnify:CR=1 FL=1|uniref:Phosphate-specific transport system accessory protein PhoU n=1 Tax=Longibaculum muris TaxID=1796628 RepID=A0A4R3Z2L6_9FIRM|nr:phosphate signaling complex protein PhoU [Longibaculum muris]KXU42522.1 phosphate transport system regulatory protein PhoU [Candidatus Stoquefichus sp. KLE1796]MBS5368485.1 phosphate signaling complex protein PhoU [Coprobacillus cateniformis]MCR1887923.1 phosphate signaling complex protein PhoU [Longibaculum muris]MED9812912.1 phosphate signaling complex protein PhoU [Longibaculum muris]TCV98518.1 phosphate transport system protein [Longibaculum muris]